jgi:hypothetical protein
MIVAIINGNGFLGLPGISNLKYSAKDFFGNGGNYFFRAHMEISIRNGNHFLGITGNTCYGNVWK